MFSGPCYRDKHMNETVELLGRAVLIGAGATVVMDLWAAFLKRAFGVARLDYRLLGRWIRHLSHGRLVHDSIARSEPVRGELYRERSEENMRITFVNDRVTTVDQAER